MSFAKNEVRLGKLLDKIYPNTVTKGTDKKIEESWKLIDGFFRFYYMPLTAKPNVKHFNYHCLGFSFNMVIKSMIHPEFVIKIENGATLEGERIREFENHPLEGEDRLIIGDFSKGDKNRFYNDILPLNKKEDNVDSPGIRFLIYDRTNRKWSDPECYTINELGMRAMYDYWQTEVLPKFKKWKKGQFHPSIILASRQYLIKYMLDRLIPCVTSIYRYNYDDMD